MIEDTPIVIKTIPLETIRWPKEFDARLLKVESIDHLCVLSVSPNFQTFRCTFPVRIFSIDNDLLEYVWITQFHSSRQCPLHFVYPLLSVLKTYGEETADLLGILNGFENYCTERSDYIITKLPPLDQDALAPSHFQNVHFNKELQTDSLFIDTMEASSFIYKTINSQIEAFNNDVLLRTDSEFEFIEFFNSKNQTEYYKISTDIFNITDFYTKKQYPFKEICHNALTLYQRYHSYKLFNQTNLLATSTNAIPYSEKVLYRCVVEGDGDFLYYQDHRVKCYFEDGTFIEIKRGDMNRKVACVIDSFGVEKLIRVEQPTGYKEHILKMLQFSDWATLKESCV
jgi:hypothetical protein